MVYCHEFLSDRWSYRPYIDRLRDLGFDVFTFDFRNHGESQSEPGYEPMHWASDREVIRRLHGVGAIDREIGNGLQARNERRRKGLSVIVDRYYSRNRLSLRGKRAILIDTLHMLTSFESFDDLAKGRSADEVIEIIAKLAVRVLSSAPKSGRRR